MSIYDDIGLSRLLKDGLIEIPNSIKNIKIDIGLSYSAPNSKLWLDNLSDRIVFGFQPHPENINSITNLGLTKYVNFKLIRTALDDVDRPTTMDFYMTKGDPGCSSLYKPTKYLGYDIRGTTKVPVVSLHYFMSKIPWDRFQYIQHLKIDTQGKDFCILKSIKDYLEKIVFVNVQTTTFDHYQKQDDSRYIDRLLQDRGFRCIEQVSAFTRGWHGTKSNVIVDKKYLNKRFRQVSKQLNCMVV